MKLAAWVDDSDGVEDPSVLNRTSLMMSAGDFNATGGSGVVLVNGCLLLGGL